MLLEKDVGFCLLESGQVKPEIFQSTFIIIVNSVELLQEYYTGITALYLLEYTRGSEVEIELLLTSVGEPVGLCKAICKHIVAHNVDFLAWIDFVNNLRVNVLGIAHVALNWGIVIWRQTAGA